MLFHVDRNTYPRAGKHQVCSVRVYVRAFTTRYLELKLIAIYGAPLLCNNPNIYKAMKYLSL